MIPSPAPRLPLIGLCPIGKFVFSHEDAQRQKALLEEKLKLWQLPYVGLDEVVPDGLLRDQHDVDRVVRHLRAQGVDCLFLPHCNFGTEGAAAMVAKQLGVPTLLWGPRDEAPLPDGTRLRDTLCGLFATSKVLHKLAVPFTYLENCRVDEPPLEIGLKNFLRAVSVVKGLKGLRLGRLGVRIDFFWTTICSESELLERFGIEVLPLDLIPFLRAVRRRAQKNEPQYREELQELKQTLTLEGFADETPILRVLALRDELLERAAGEGLSGYAIQSFMSLCEELGSVPDLGTGLCTAAGIPCACETDLHGAISMVLLQRAALGSTPPFLSDLTVRHPEDDNAVLLWHSDFPLTLKADDSPAKLAPHWILPGMPSGMPHWRLKGGPVTVARFDGDGGEYRLALGEGQATTGPETRNVYLWMKVADWPRWERHFIEGPYIHHVACAHGRYAPALYEACRFLPGLVADPVESNGEALRARFFTELL